MRRDLTGSRFGRWTVIGEAAPKINPSGRARRWLVRCDCGSEPKAVSQGVLLAGGSKSCGCLHVERSRDFLRQRNTTHGLSRTPEYQAWADMKRRCLNEKHPKWRLWGGRGITVCE